MRVTNFKIGEKKKDCFFFRQHIYFAGYKS